MREITNQEEFFTSLKEIKKCKQSVYKSIIKFNKKNRNKIKIINATLNICRSFIK